MKFIDKIVSTVILLVLCSGVYVYSINYDMYDMVGEYGAIAGYASLVDCLRDEGWVEASVERWERSRSPVMHGLYAYLTDASDELPDGMIAANRTLLAFCYIVSVASWPLCLCVRAGRVNGKLLKELHKK